MSDYILVSILHGIVGSLEVIQFYFLKQGRLSTGAVRKNSSFVTRKEAEEGGYDVRVCWRASSCFVSLLFAILHFRCERIGFKGQLVQLYVNSLAIY